MLQFISDKCLRVLRQTIAIQLRTLVHSTPYLLVCTRYVVYNANKMLFKNLLKNRFFATLIFLYFGLDSSKDIVFLLYIASPFRSHDIRSK